MPMGWFTVKIEDIEVKQYTYVAFPSYYVWNKALKKWTKRK